jgi:hypothetical protein
MIFISCIACFTKYVKQYYSSANAYLEAVDNSNRIQEKQIKKKTFNNIREYFIEKHPIRFTLLYIIIITVYSFAVSPLGKNYRIIKHFDVGFCTLSVEYFPQLIIVLSFLLLYVPYIINELRKIEDPFKIKNLLYITVIAMCIGVVGYLVSSLVPKYNCTPEFIRIWPTDCFIILTCTIFHFLHVIKPLIELFYVKFSMRKIDKSMQGLKKVLKDKTLFREYAEFCKNECCVENTLFYKEYIEFKDTIYKITNKKNIENNISISTLISNDKDITIISNNDSSTLDNLDNGTQSSLNNDSSSDFKNINTDSNYSNLNSSYNTESRYTKEDHILLLKKAQDIIDKFILPNSEYEINIDTKISKKIINTLNNYEKKGIENSLYIEDFENSEFVNIFDEAYEEVIQSLYINIYSAFVLYKRKHK